MVYSITIKDAGQSRIYETFDYLHDAQMAFEDAMETLEPSGYESIQLLGKRGDVIETHIF